MDVTPAPFAIGGYRRGTRKRNTHGLRRKLPAVAFLSDISPSRISAWTSQGNAPSAEPVRMQYQAPPPSELA
jgi:hypothetical protein